MRIAILSRNKNLHSVRRLLHEAKRQRVQCDIVNPLECQLVVDGKQSRILIGHRELPTYDAILPRIGASITAYGLAVVKHFESIGVRAINDSMAIAESRDKMRCLQVMASIGIQTPPTVLTRNRRGLAMAVHSVRGMPVIVKLLKGTQGVGVMLINTPIALGSVLDTLHGLDQDVIIQQFLAQAAGRDYRAFVVGNKIVAAMLRTAPEGEFRSNIHRGGHGRLVKLPKNYERAAIRATKALGLQIAGVDMMDGGSGPLVIEVNSSPGFEGIEKATGLNIAGAIIKHIKNSGRKKTRSSLSKKRTRRGRRR